MRHILFAGLAAAALVGCSRPEPAAPAPEAERVQPFDLHIEIGRYGVMLDQVADIGDRTSAADAADPEDPRALARALREAAWDYNLKRSRLCAANFMPEVSCGPAYNPVWLADPADAEVSLEALQGRAQELGERVMPLWNAVCDHARAQVTDEDEQRLVCAIE